MTVSLKTVLHVRITDDRPLTMAFLRWMQTEDVYPVRHAASSCGPDFYNGVFPFKHRAKIEAFFKEGRFSA